MKKTLFNARIDDDLIKEFKILCIRLGKRQNQLLEESMKDTLKKYETQNQPIRKS
jgi:hypothetical protein